MEIMKQVEGMDLHERKGARFFFPIYYNKRLAETPIEALDLNVRSYNCLKRAGFDFVGELAEATAGGDILKRIRNCGAKSAREIMEKMFIYQYEILSPERKEQFIKAVIEMNRAANG